MSPQKFRNRLRRLGNKFVLNQGFTAVYDRFFPARTLGARGEREAERFLLRKGHIIVDRGFDDGNGELDLVAIDCRTVVFVEVKTRASTQFGMPSEAVTDQKQLRICRTAQSFMKKHDLMECKSRFDIISILWPANKSPEIEHIENAFDFALDVSMVPPRTPK